MFDWFTSSKNSETDVPIVSSRITNVVDPDGVQAFLNTNHPMGSQVPFTLPPDQLRGLEDVTMEMAVFPKGQPPQQHLQSQFTAQPVAISSMAPSTGFSQPYGMQPSFAGPQSQFFNPSSAPGMPGQGQSGPNFNPQPPSLMQQPPSYGGLGTFNPSMVSLPSNMQQHMPLSFGGQAQPSPSPFSHQTSNVQQFSGMPQGGLQPPQFGQSAGFLGQPSTSFGSQAIQGAHSAWNANPPAQMTSFFPQSQGTGFGGSSMQQPSRWGQLLHTMPQHPQRPVSFINSLGQSGFPSSLQSAMSGPQPHSLYSIYQQSTL